MGYSKGEIKIGDWIVAEEDVETDLRGKVRDFVDDDTLDVFYPTLDEGFDVPYEQVHAVYSSFDIKEVAPEANVPSTEPVPEAPMQNVPSGTVDLDAQRKIHPGHIVTWVKRGSHGKKFHDDRLFVILNFTKNSNRTKVNIAPLNGKQPGEPQAYDYYAVPVNCVQPLAFPAPLRKMKAN